jgi:Methyltransferase domain
LARPSYEVDVRPLPLLVLRELAGEVWRAGRKGRWRLELLRGAFNRGRCPVCDRPTVFIEREDWLRDHFRCLRCRSIPRWRALAQVLDDQFPNWRSGRLHESSPYGSVSDRLRTGCSGYVGTHYYPHAAPGEMVNGFRSENLEKQTFPDASFDLVITLDVMEHVLNPDRAFSEISRTLKPGGAHVFTVPWYYWKPTLVRAVEKGGAISHVEPPDYHGNPIDESGALVVTEWGTDMLEFIQRNGGLVTEVVRMTDRRLGIAGEFIEVFVSRKAG